MSSTRKPWTRGELLILLNLYEKIPFGKFDRSNRVLIDVATRMGRTPGSVAMKLSNLASLDERLRRAASRAPLVQAPWIVPYGPSSTRTTKPRPRKAKRCFRS